MLSELDLIKWLQVQPLDEVIDVDGEKVYLRRYSSGAELGGSLVQHPTYSQILRAMEQAFSYALEFDAGLALSEGNTELKLTQWLPGVNHWTEASKPLENLLNQLSSWRAAIAPAEATQVAKKTTIDRNAQRLRMLFAGENS